VRWLAGLMRVFVFPRGLTYFAPSDRQCRKIVDLVMTPGTARDRLAHGIYRTVEPGNPTGLLQEALELAVIAEPLERKLRVDGVKTGKVTALDLPGQIDQAEAAGILSPAEATYLRDYDRKVMAIVNVDDFAPHELGRGSTPESHLATHPHLA
jgi:acyl-CoA dehydrogenase